MPPLVVKQIYFWWTLKDWFVRFYCMCGILPPFCCIFQFHYNHTRYFEEKCPLHGRWKRQANNQQAPNCNGRQKRLKNKERREEREWRWLRERMNRGTWERKIFFYSISKLCNTKILLLFIVEILNKQGNKTKYMKTNPNCLSSDY